MDGTSNELLACAALTANNYCRRRARHAPNGLEDVMHGIRRTKQVAQTALPLNFIAQDAVFTLDAQLLDGAFDEHTQHVGIKRLEEIVVRARIDDLERCGLFV